MIKMNDKLNDNSNFNQVLSTNTNTNTNVNNIEQEKKIVSNFPDWDLLPPFQTVRRITRK